MRLRGCTASQLIHQKPAVDVAGTRTLSVVALLESVAERAEGCLDIFLWYIASEVRDWILKRAIRDELVAAKGEKLMGRPTNAKALRNKMAVAPRETAA